MDGWMNFRMDIHPWMLWKSPHTHTHIYIWTEKIQTNQIDSCKHWMKKKERRPRQAGKQAGKKKIHINFDISRH